MTVTCPAALNIKGEHFPCDQMKHMAEGSTHHNGWSHSNTEAGAIWTEDNTKGEGMDGYLRLYCQTREMDVPFYKEGSKITEEAAELREAVLSGIKERVMEEAFDVFVTALVACRQFGTTLEEAARLKIAKDKGRGSNDTYAH